MEPDSAAARRPRTVPEPFWSPGNMMRAALVLTVVIGSILYVTFPVDNHVLYLAVVGVASAAAWIGAFRTPSGSRLVPQLIAAGLTASAIGDVVFDIFDVLGRSTDISPADVAYFAGYVALASALVITLVQTSRRIGEDVDAAIDALTIVVVSVLIFWSLSVNDIVTDTSVPWFVRAVWAAYPVSDAILLALVLRVLLNRRARSMMGVWFAIGVICWLAADVGYLLLVVSGAGAAWLDGRRAADGALHVAWA